MIVNFCSTRWLSSIVSEARVVEVMKGLLVPSIVKVQLAEMYNRTCIKFVVEWSDELLESNHHATANTWSTLLGQYADEVVAELNKEKK